MAFIRQSGSSYQVRQGNNNKLLRTFGSREKAQKYVDMLHKEHKPKSKNRGSSAKGRFTK